MEGVHIGCGQITWPRATPTRQVLAEIARAGYDGAPCGSHTGLSPQDTVALYAQQGLQPAPGYLSGLFWLPEARDKILEGARREAAFTAKVGCTEIFVAPDGFDHWTTLRGLTRSQTAAHSTPADMLTADEFKRFGEVLSEVGRITLQQGVRACVHNHVGTPIETREEIDKLFSVVDPEVVFQGPDIGHLAWAGGDVSDFCNDYGSRIKSWHIKDLNQAVRLEGIANEWDYRGFTDHGIWTELGTGALDWVAFRDFLQESNFEGWIIVETDVTQLATALESAIISREYLQRLGL